MSVSSSASELAAMPQAPVSSGLRRWPDLALRRRPPAEAAGADGDAQGGLDGAPTAAAHRGLPPASMCRGSGGQARAVSARWERCRELASPSLLQRSTSTGTRRPASSRDRERSGGGEGCKAVARVAVRGGPAPRPPSRAPAAADAGAGSNNWRRGGAGKGIALLLYSARNSGPVSRPLV
ncbi:hypothetical protein C2845_PM09G08110 [Panicum miliaceum]|uniref:Uncharacterized protein n=1 Tax=Panicum miliaceum TaxID=4540 RepID=A0A3L6RWU0_PANMI|nr:hypothetical protein C2845_PM09G08110 [Panicum miliaceum]